MMTDATNSIDMSEDYLWNEWMFAEVRHYEAGLRYRTAWREYVQTGLSDSVKSAGWNRWAEVWHGTRADAERTRVAWKRVAYPLYDIPITDDEKSSS